MSVSERIPYFSFPHKVRSSERVVAYDGQGGEEPRRSRLQEREKVEKVTDDPEIATQIKQRILAIRRAALEAPGHGVVHDGVVRGIPFRKEEFFSSDFIEQVLPRAESGGTTVTEDVLSGKVIRIIRLHGRCDEYITFARGVGDKDHETVITTIALETEQDDTGKAHVKRLTLTESTNSEAATLSLDPDGDGVTLVDYATQEERKLFHGNKKAELSEGVIDELDQIRRAISEEVVSLSTLEAVQERTQEARKNLQEVRNQYDELMKKFKSLEERISGTRRFILRFDAYYESHDEEYQATSSILAQLISERDEIEEQLACLLRPPEMSKTEDRRGHRIKRLGLRAINPVTYALVGSTVAGIYHATH